MNILTDNQEVDLELDPRSAKENVTNVENVKWSSSDESVMTVAQDPANPLMAVAKATGKLGNAQVAAEADARIGEGEVLLLGTADFEVRAGEAVTLGIKVGAPRDQTPS